MSDEIKNNTNEYIKENGHALFLYAYLNTNTGQIFETSKLIKETTNVKHLIRVKNLDKFVNLEYED